MRALIEKPAMQGVEEYFVGLTMALHHEEQSTDMVAEDTTIGDKSRSSKHRRQSATHVATPDDEDPFDELSEPNRTFLSTSKSSARQASSSMNGVCVRVHMRIHTPVQSTVRFATRGGTRARRTTPTAPYSTCHRRNA